MLIEFILLDLLIETDNSNLSEAWIIRTQKERLITAAGYSLEMKQ